MYNFKSKPEGVVHGNFVKGTSKLLHNKYPIEDRIYSYANTY